MFELTLVEGLSAATQRKLETQAVPLDARLPPNLSLKSIGATALVGVALRYALPYLMRRQAWKIVKGPARKKKPLVASKR